MEKCSTVYSRMVCIDSIVQYVRVIQEPITAHCAQAGTVGHERGHFLGKDDSCSRSFHIYNLHTFHYFIMPHLDGRAEILPPVLCWTPSAPDSIRL